MTPHELIPGPSLKRPPWDGRNGERGEDNAAKIKGSADLISASFNLRGFIRIVLVGSSIASSLHNSVL